MCLFKRLSDRETERLSGLKCQRYNAIIRNMKLKRENIEFTCEKCGDCCRAEGYVYLKTGEIERIASFLNKPAKEFKKEFTEWLLWRGRVIKQDDEGCVLLVDGRCAVYEARPSQCSEFPFWKHVLNDTKWWEYFKTYCPGVRKARVLKP
jgi:Fe-S-cluster containining protein